ncbi:Avt1p Ecym_8272 [Eremothecium cymbalariae DBVPG|uniref:Amino acid transporter transmembrane domain-containing protein n=1 Tax=Eremothecium cymbalariae (strain CBS 270.75 / DBVPG 7215 / KCTC 17166 / NRRL Y-17582) TaxID=931890 RepID=G8JXI0_ERECY|nr:Hypothetical protein Ecym_8272 [Eremothecium cymbalariae DBVPG\
MPRGIDQEQQPLRGSPSSHVNYIEMRIDRQKAEHGDVPQNNVSNNTPGSFGAHHTSIFDQNIGSFRGVNSLGRFATSFQRANSFKAIELNTGKERAFLKDGYDELYDPDTLAPSLNGRRLSIAIGGQGSVSIRPCITDLYGSIGTGDSNTPRRDSEAILDDVDSMRLGRGFSNQSLTFHDINNGISLDEDSILLKQVETKGKVITVIAGQSTAPQTIFNSVNVLIGIGLLALPLGLRYAGWILGLLMLSIFAFSTFCSAELLSRCIDADPTMISFGDLAYAAFGSNGRALISLLFTLDLLGCGVSLVILFGDSLNALFPMYSVTFYKMVAFFLITPQVFMPLNLLSNFSLLGIVATISTVLTIFFCGIFKTTSPGSLWHPAPSQLWPMSFLEFCLSIGLLSACWGGHAVFPNLKADMRHPQKFHSCLKTTYSITASTDMGIAVVGFLMFGNAIKDEITRSVMLTKGYPQAIYVLISVLMAIIPIAKTPLNARPIISTLDVMTGVRDSENEMDEEKSYFTKITKFLNRIGTNIVFVLLAIYFPEFDKLIAFLGAGLCFLICLILPCMFYLRICEERVLPWERFACYLTIFISSVLSILGITAAIIA